MLFKQNRNAACGQYKEEILSQLREIAKSEPSFSDCKEDTEHFMQLQSGEPEQDLQPGDMYAGFERGSELATIPSYEVIFFLLFKLVELATIICRLVLSLVWYFNGSTDLDLYFALHDCSMVLMLTNLC